MKMFSRYREKPLYYQWNVTAPGWYRLTVKRLNSKKRYIMIRWGDDMVDTESTGDGEYINIDHWYEEAGIYTVSLKFISKLADFAVYDAVASTDAHVTTDPLPTPTVSTVIVTSVDSITPTSFNLNLSNETSELKMIRVLIDTVSPISETPLYDELIPGSVTSVVITGLSEDTTYYYQVGGEETINGHQTFSALSEIASTKTMDLSAFVVDSPEDRTTVGFHLTWTETDEAEVDNIRIQIATDSGFTNKIVDTTVAKTEYEYTLTSGIQGTLYYYRIRAEKTISGIVYAGVWSNTESGTTNTVRSIVSNSYEGLTVDGGTITWIEDSGEADEILVQASLNSNYSSPFIDTSVEPDVLEKIVSGQLQNVDIYYRMRGKKTVGLLSQYSAWSTGMFTTSIVEEPTIDVATELAENGFTANWFHGEVGDIDTYEVQYDTSSSFTNPTSVTGIASTETSTGISGLDFDTQYYYRVRAKKTEGGVSQYSAWSEYESAHTTEPVLAEIDTWNFDEDMVKNIYAAPEFTEGHIGTITYQIAADEFFENIIDEIEISTSPYDLDSIGGESGIVEDSTYYVRSKNVYEGYSIGWSEAEQISTSTIKTFVLATNTPALHKIICDFEDAGGKDCDNIIVTIAEDEEFESIIETLTLANDVTSFETTEPLEEGSDYYICVRSKVTRHDHIMYGECFSGGKSTSIVGTATTTSATSVLSDGFTANWTDNADGLFDSWLLEISRNSSFSPVHESHTVSSSTFAKAITDLDSSTSYYYRVFGIYTEDETQYQGTASNATHVVTGSK